MFLDWTSTSEVNRRPGFPHDIQINKYRNKRSKREMLDKELITKAVNQCPDSGLDRWAHDTNCWIR